MIAAKSSRSGLFASSLLVSLPALLLSASVQAQIAPDAGRVLQEAAPPRLEAPNPSPVLDIKSPALPDSLPGGAQVELKTLRITGNTRYSEADLLASLGEVTGNTYDLAGLKGLANRISEHYRAAGYAFAMAYLPAQDMKDGTLTIDVVEGRYGQILASGDPELSVTAQAFLSSLRSGDVIESAPLERLTLLMDDLPGVHVTPILRPGQAVGSGDLNVQVERTPRVGAELGLDNNGNRYTGYHRVRLNLNADSPFMPGDQITLNSLYSDENMWLGNLGYSLPLGVSGLRGQISYGHTAYKLAREFASAEASGTAKTTTLGLTYPLIRTQRANLNLSWSLQHKALFDRQGAANTQSSKSSNLLPLSLGFNRRDELLGGGINYGSLTWTYGKLDLGTTAIAQDQASARTQGHFDKLNLDLARVQALPANFSLYGRVSAQTASKNLDSSEKFGLGGAYGVRAYPSGEGFGDKGWLTQIELRYAIDAFTPYAFYDTGRVTTNAEPWAAGTNSRSLAGGGMGVRYQQGGWSMDALLAWRIEGGKPVSDTEDKRPMGWFNVGYKF